MVTAYDYTAARIADAAGIPIILVGDSLGMVVLGYDSTVPVTMDDMVRHGRMVSRGASQALVVVDLPFMSYQVDAGEALRNAGRLMQEAGAHTVKMEGGVSIAEHGAARCGRRRAGYGSHRVDSAVGERAGRLPGAGAHQGGGAASVGRRAGACRRPGRTRSCSSACRRRWPGRSPSG